MCVCIVLYCAVILRHRYHHLVVLVAWLTKDVHCMMNDGLTDCVLEVGSHLPERSLPPSLLPPSLPPSPLPPSLSRFCDVCADTEEGLLPDTVWNGEGQWSMMRAFS